MRRRCKAPLTLASPAFYETPAALINHPKTLDNNTLPSRNGVPLGCGPKLKLPHSPTAATLSPYGLRRVRSPRSASLNPGRSLALRDERLS